MEDVNKRAQELQAQVQQLQTKLHEVHSTDVNTLRRSFRSISQHINALKHEATALEARVQSLEPELYPPEYIAEQVAQVGVVTATTYGACKLLQDVPMAPRARAWLRSSVVMVAFVLIGWRLAAGSVARFAKALREHQTRRRQLLQEWEALKQRIDMLLALTQTAGPYLAGASPLSSSSGSSSRERLVAAAGGSQQQQQAGEGAATGSGASGGDAGGGVTGRNGDFVVLDLPRVDSCPAMSGTASPGVMVDMPQGASARTSSGGSSSGGGAGAAPSTTQTTMDSAAADTTSSTGIPEVGGSSTTTADSTTAAAGSGGTASQELAAGTPPAAAASTPPTLTNPSNSFSSGWGGVVARPTASLQSPTMGGSHAVAADLATAASAESDADWVQAGSSQAPLRQQQTAEQQQATAAGAHSSSSSRPGSPARTSPSMSDAVLLDADDSD